MQAGGRTAPRPLGRDAEAAMRRHRERFAFLARRRGAPLPAPAAAAAAAVGGRGGAEVKAEVKAEEAEEAEEVVICKLERAVEAAEGTPAAAGGGRKRRWEEDGAEAGPSGRGAGGGRQAGHGGRGASRFRGVSKDKRLKAKTWQAKIQVTEDGKGRYINIACFAREEDAARAYDRVSIANSGHAKAKTNFPVAEYREEWAELEALGVEGAVAMVREHAAAERPDVMNKTSRFRGVGKLKGAKVTKPWKAKIYATKDSKGKSNYIGTFAREEDAARAYDRVKIAKLGHAKAETNFPVAQYRAEWARLEALGVDGAVAW